MRSFKYILVACILLGGLCCIAEPAAYAQSSQIVKSFAKRAGKSIEKKAGGKAAKEAAEEAGEVAGKRLAKEGVQGISKELTEKAIRENAEKSLAKKARKEASDRALKEVAPAQVKKTFSKNVAKNVGKDATKIFKGKVVGLAVKSSDDIGAQFAKKLGTSEAKESLESTAKRGLKHSQELKAAEKQGLKGKVESQLLSSKIKKTAIYKELAEIQAKGAIELSEKEFRALVENPNYLRAYIETFTGSKKNFQEFFIRLAMGNKEQAARISDLPWVKEYLKKSIRAGGVHEWLMTKNFREFILDPKWGDDGPFLALSLTRFVQSTKNINFKPRSIYGVGGHPASGRINSTASINWHNDLAEVISRCNSKEELFVSIKHFAKDTLTEESYREFCEIFSSLFKAVS